jgi:hypothetical protein
MALVPQIIQLLRLVRDYQRQRFHLAPELVTLGDGFGQIVAEVAAFASFYARSSLHV